MRRALPLPLRLFLAFGLLAQPACGFIGDLTDNDQQAPGNGSSVAADGNSPAAMPLQSALYLQAPAGLGSTAGQGSGAASPTYLLLSAAPEACDIVQETLADNLGNLSAGLTQDKLDPRLYPALVLVLPPAAPPQTTPVGTLGLDAAANASVPAPGSFLATALQRDGAPLPAQAGATLVLTASDGDRGPLAGSFDLKNGNAGKFTATYCSPLGGLFRRGR